MRDIIFRGKRTDNGEWVEGYYAMRDGDAVIYSGRVDVVEATYIGHGLYEEYECDECFSVDPDTVGEWTGLCDKSGTKVFEGDIVEAADLKEGDGYAKIKWDEDVAKFVIFGYGLVCDFDSYYGHELEVIGNIYDNADLMDE